GLTTGQGVASCPSGGVSCPSGAGSPITDPLTGIVVSGGGGITFLDPASAWNQFVDASSDNGVVGSTTGGSWSCPSGGCPGGFSAADFGLSCPGGGYSCPSGGIQQAPDPSYSC